MAFELITPRSNIIKANHMVSITILQHPRTKTLRAQISIADSQFTALLNYDKITCAKIYNGVDENTGQLKIEFLVEPSAAAFKVSKGTRNVLNKKIQVKHLDCMPNTKFGMLPCAVLHVIPQDRVIVIQLPIDKWKEAAGKSKETERFGTLPAENAKEAVATFNRISHRNLSTDHSKIIEGMKEKPTTDNTRYALPTVVGEIKKGEQRPLLETVDTPVRPIIDSVMLKKRGRSPSNAQKIIDKMAENIKPPAAKDSELLDPVLYLKRKGYAVVRMAGNEDRWRIQNTTLESDNVTTTITTEALCGIINKYRREYQLPPIGKEHLKIEELEDGQ